MYPIGPHVSIYGETQVKVIEKEAEESSDYKCQCILEMLWIAAKMNNDLRMAKKFQTKRQFRKYIYFSPSLWFYALQATNYYRRKTHMSTE